jgi:hypothetical protein
MKHNLYRANLCDERTLTTCHYVRQKEKKNIKRNKE